MVSPPHLQKKRGYFELPVALEFCGVTIVAFCFRSRQLKTVIMAEAFGKRTFSTYTTTQAYIGYRLEDIEAVNDLARVGAVFQITPPAGSKI